MSDDVKVKIEHFRRTMEKKLAPELENQSEVPKDEVGKKCTKVKKCPKAKCPEVPKSKGAKTHFPKVKKEPGAGAQQAHGGPVVIAAVMGCRRIKTRGHGVALRATHEKRMPPTVEKEHFAEAQQAHGGLVGIAAVMGRPPIQTPGGVPHKKRILPKVGKAWMKKAAC